MKAIEMRTSDLRKRDVSFTDTGFPYTLDDICVDGGYFTLYIPAKWDVTEENIKREKAYIKSNQDVCGLNVVKCKFIKK
jgi:hypothetical protein